MKATQRISILLPDLRGGGAERITVNLANNLVARGYLVDMVLLTATGPFLEFLHPDVRLVNLAVNRMRGLPAPLIRYLRCTKPDALLATMWPLTVIAVIARKIASVATRLILAEHVTWSASQIEYSYLQRMIIRGTMRAFFPGADGVVAVSNGAADDFTNFARLGRDKITTIYNPVIDSLADRVESNLIEDVGAWSNAKFRILTVGHLKIQKNHELLIRSFSVLRKHLNVHLLILGEGDLRKKLEELIDELGLNDCVSMPGFISDPQPYYQRASLFVLSSDWEGLPTVLIEALDAGTTVVSTDCPSGPREILNGGQFGRLVPMGDAELLAAAMAESLAKPYDPCSLQARAKDFSIEKATDQYLELFFPKNSPDYRA